jgi:large subunit ribosomal protein L20
MVAWSKKKYQKLAKGYEGAWNHCLKRMINRVQKGMQKAYRDRRLKRRNYRRQWILNINAATREHNLPYSRFIYGLNRSNIKLDRKILCNLAINEPYSFKAIVDEVKVQAKIGMLDQNVAPISFYEALADRKLVFGKVKPPEPEKQELPYIRFRSDADPKLKAQFVIDDKPHAIDQEMEWIFKHKK